MILRFCLLIFLQMILGFLLSGLQVSATDTSCPAEVAMAKAGLVDIQSIDPSIRVDLKYSTPDNFVGIDVYGCISKAFMQKDAAKQLAGASALLQKKNPNLRLLVYDAARPKWAQQILWDSIKKPEDQKHVYVADPRIGSIHNYGCAVDLTICDPNGKALDMGTPYDFFGLLAQPRKEWEFLKSGKLTKLQIENRLLLRRIMKQKRFQSITSEWWHFNYGALRSVKAKYSIVQ